LHTGRSRNDQVATDSRLWLRKEAQELLKVLNELIKTCVERAEKEIDFIMPGYTHLQRAQPIRWSHFLLMYAWMWKSDAERLQQVVQRINQLPLGSGALAGNPFEVDREFLAKKLGFEGIISNSLYGVSDRDFVVEFLFWGTLTMNHLSKWAEDLIIFSSAEFGFVTLSDAYSTGSSLMPQKKNPDSLELLRGKSGRIFGQCAGFLMTTKGLCSTYNKDLQEDKEPMFDCAKTMSSCLRIACGVLKTLTANHNRMRNALTYDMLATDLAEYLVRKGVPFRETHHIAGAAVKMAEQKKTQINQLSLEDLKSLHAAFEADVNEIWNFEKSIENRRSIGGTSSETVQKQIESLKSWLNQN
jgi:argininosuccinate lyase